MNNNLREEYNYYSEKGEKLKMVFKLNDFLNNKETNIILNNEWNEIFRKQIETPLLELISEEKKKELNKGSPLFMNDKGMEFERDLINHLYFYIKKQYDLEIFYNNPELAKNLLAN